jgi:hypothetical protein
MVIAFAESLPGGRASAVATVRPRSGVQLSSSGPPRDMVEMCNDLPTIARGVLGVLSTDGSGAREAVGPWTVGPQTCVRWFPRGGIESRTVFYYAESDEWDADGERTAYLTRDGTEAFCTPAELAMDSLVRWFSNEAPEEASCDRALARRHLASLPMAAWTSDARGTRHATVILRAP